MKFQICLISLLLLSCSQSGNNSDLSCDFKITSPGHGWIYYDESPVLFSVNTNEINVKWHSSVDGNLGEGNNIFKWISPGSHRLTAQINGYSNIIEFEVKQRNIKTNDEIKLLLFNSPLVRKFLPGKYYPVLSSFQGKVENFYYNDTNLTGKISLSKKIYDSDPDNNFFKRNIRPEIKLNTEKYSGNIQRTPQRTAIRYSLKSDPFSVGDTKNFHVINTVSPENHHTISAELYWSTENLNVWVPVGKILNFEKIDFCIEKISSLILPRIKTIWGEVADIDNNGKITVLFSSTINEEDLALGFFNPGDFFQKNTDFNSDLYNPSSNESDIIYVAVPEDNSESYNEHTITATIAHELTHAVTFSVKTWANYVKTGQYKREELFLDEGLSHLSENLCGFGLSGGNIRFFDLYLRNTAQYSFCGKDYLGRTDSAGMRGAMTLFMSWLFWKMGGMEWDNEIPAYVLDNGGIQFLRKLLSISETGWESIGNALGKPADELLAEMIYEINVNRINDNLYPYKKDKLTDEPVEFFVNMGDFEINNSILNIGLPKIYLYDSMSKISTLPYSYILLEPVTICDESIKEFFFSSANGTVYFSSIYQD